MCWWIKPEEQHVVWVQAVDDPPLSFSRASMLMCSLRELRKSSITLMISTSFTFMISSAVMVTSFHRKNERMNASFSNV